MDKGKTALFGASRARPLSQPQIATSRRRASHQARKGAGVLLTYCLSSPVKLFARAPSKIAPTNASPDDADLVSWVSFARNEVASGVHDLISMIAEGLKLAFLGLLRFKTRPPVAGNATLVDHKPNPQRPPSRRYCRFSFAIILGYLEHPPCARSFSIYREHL